MKQLCFINNFTHIKKPAFTGLFKILLKNITFFNMLIVISHEITGKNAQKL